MKIIKAMVVNNRKRFMIVGIEKNNTNIFINIKKSQIYEKSDFMKNVRKLMAISLRKKIFLIGLKQFLNGFKIEEKLLNEQLILENISLLYEIEKSFNNLINNIVLKKLESDKLGISYLIDSDLLTLDNELFNDLLNKQKDYEEFCDNNSFIKSNSEKYSELLRCVSKAIRLNTVSEDDKKIFLGFS